MTIKNATARCAAAAALALILSHAANGQDVVRHRIDIQSQPIAAALRALATQTGLQVIVMSEDAGGKHSPAIKGTLSNDEALQRLLQDSGLTFEKIDGNTVAIRPVGAAAPTAHASPVGALRLAQAEHAADGSGTAGKSESADEDGVQLITVFGRIKQDRLADVPQSVSVFDDELLELSATTTVGDVLRFVPNASRNGSTLNAFGDSYLIRGFDANQTINGTGFNRLNHARDTVNVERVEVLKGPASVLYGQMQPGGVINVVTKQPLDVFRSEMGLELGSYSDHRYSLDVTGPLGARVRGRVTAAYRESESYLDFWDVEHLFVSPVLAFDVADRTSLTLEGSFSRNDWGSSINGVPAVGTLLPNPNGRIRRSFNPTEPSVDDTRRESHDLSLRLVHGIGERTSLRATINSTHNEYDFVEVFAYTMAPDQRTIDRVFFIGEDEKEDDRSFQLDLSTELDTGPVRHRLVFGAEYRRFKGRLHDTFVFADPIDIFEPVYGGYTLPEVELPTFRQDFDAKGAFFQDRMAFGDRWSLIAGARYNDAQQATNYITPTGEEFPDRIEESDVSTQLGVLCQATSRLSLFASRAESFVPQFGTSSGGRPFASEESVQYELGAKLALAGSGIAVDAAVFQIEKSNVVTSDPGSPGSFAPLGEVRTRGFEASINGRPAPGWLLAAGYGHLDSEITRNFDGLEGNELRNTPGDTFSLETRYDLRGGRLAGLGFGATVEHLSSRYGDDVNSFELPSHTRLDLGVYYEPGERYDFSLLVNNVTDETIYAEAFSQQRVILELDRAVLARFRLRL
jgi:iron complex outermembrane receptor protein